MTITNTNIKLEAYSDRNDVDDNKLPVGEGNISDNDSNYSSPPPLKKPKMMAVSEFPTKLSPLAITDTNQANSIIEKNYQKETENHTMNSDIHTANCEMGFFLLQDTTIYLRRSCSVDDTIVNNTDRFNHELLNQWIDVTIVDTDTNHNPTCDCHVEECPRCNLILRHDGDENDKVVKTLSYHPSNILFFDGTMKDITVCNNLLHHLKNGTKSDSSNNKQVLRSDAALLLGALMKCQRDRYIQIESFKILLVENELSYHSNNTNIHSNNTDYECEKFLASISVTVSLPHLQSVDKKNDSKNPTQINYDEDFLSTHSPKKITPLYQLLLTLIRSDWDWLDSKMMELRSQQRNSSASHSNAMKQFFPSAMSLEDLYARIRGASHISHSNIQKFDFDHYSGAILRPFASRNLTSPSKSATPNFLLSHLPDEILQSKIAPYLRAKSLHHLRSTCRHLYQTLQSNVPGMKLSLFPHQKRSLSWMRNREGDQSCCYYASNTVTNEYDAMRCSPTGWNSMDEVLEGDVYRSVTCGTVVSLINRHQNPIGEKQMGPSDPQVLRVNTWSGRCLESSTSCADDAIRTIAKCRQVARGGLLCDDPGLGKTITIISLILQTFGQSTEKIDGIIDCNNQDDVISDSVIVDIYWKEVLVSLTRRELLMSLAMKLRKFDLEQIFLYPIKDILTADEWANYVTLVKDPMCLSDIIDNIEKDKYAHDLLKFKSDVMMIYKNAISYNKEGTLIYEKANECIQLFRDQYMNFHDSLFKSAMTLNRNNKSSLGSLIARSKRRELLDSLLSSHGTLLVVPSTLLQHWEEQMKLHINFHMLSDKKPLIFRHRANSHYMREYPVTETSNYRVIFELCQKKKTHYPFLFIDESTDALPNETTLAQFYIVLTTTKRLTMEWKNGSFEEELQKRSGMSYRKFNYDSFYGDKDQSPCSLLKINWLRLIVDEGHTMGKKGAPNNAIAFASWINADRRWVMTGTPTPQTVSKNGLGNLFGLFKFLNHDYFCTPYWGEERYKALDKGLKCGHLASFFRLRHLLNLLMCRHTKADVEHLHKPVFTLTHTDMSVPETLAYNTLVSAVQTNLVVTAMEGAKTSGFQDSLLHTSQSKHAKRALGNIRLACSGGTSVVPTLTHKSWSETVAIIKDKHNANETKVTLVQNFLHRMVTEQNSSCMHCGISLQTLLLLPCVCQICTECMTSKTYECPVCHTDVDPDEFQKLQPGLDFIWKWNIDEAKKERESARLMADSLEEGRLVADGPNHQRDIENIGLEADPLLNNSNRRRIRRNHAHVCVYPSMNSDGSCKLCGEFHLCEFVDNLECAVCNCKAEDCPIEESKSYYIITKLIRLLKEYEYRGMYEMTGEVKRPLKVIIYTQFQQVSNLVGDRLIRRFGRGCVAEYWGSTRNIELNRFINAKECFCMLLNRDGSHGLNLSFVTHIFFLDEILDKSLENQVIARAWRMGAAENVNVEQLVARHSIEELIVEMNKRDDLDQGVISNSSDSKKSNSHVQTSFLLKNAKLIRPQNTRARITHLTSSKHEKNRRVKFAD